MPDPLTPFAKPQIAHRAEGLNRLHAFLPRAARAYAAHRNTDFGPQDRTNVSGLSPWIRRRLITESEVVAAVLDHHSPSAAEKFIQEVCWRTYFKGFLEHRPGIWSAYQTAVLNALEDLDRFGDLRARYHDAVAGRTGIAAFDHWARELVETGWLHNHARMWFASIWIFTLDLPWALGADFFYRHLLDGDPASNTLSWRWVAGLHTAGKTYLARSSNIAKHTNGRFSGTDGLASIAPPVTGFANPAPGPLRGGDAAPSPGTPIVVLATEDDLCTEDWRLDTADVVAVAAISLDQDRSPLGEDSLVRAWNVAALADGADRAARHYNAPKLGVFDDAGALCAALTNIAPNAALLVPFAPVGPTHSGLAALRAVTHHPVMEIQRAWDTRFWPHAQKGFFALKKAIPAVLDDLGVGPSPQPRLFTDQ